MKYTQVERKAILRAYRGRYGPKIWKGPSIYELYRDFLRGQAAKGMETEVPEKEFDVYDLAALAYLYKRVKETEVISEAHHIVIDEAQDFGMMAYSALHFCIRGCTYTVMGDVSQNIHFGFGLNDWEELRALLLSDEMDSFGILKKSYRNTVEISDFATKILHHGKFSSYPIEPIIRHGVPVEVRKAEKGAELFQEAAEICRKWREKGYDTIAVVCRSRGDADRTAAGLGEYIDVIESDLEKAVFGTGIMVLPVEYTKGLEFDTVLILDPDREDYPVDDGHAKLLYVAATRALHELCILYKGDLTGLIADPIPEKAPSKESPRPSLEEGKDLQKKPEGIKSAPPRTQGQAAVAPKPKASARPAAPVQQAAARKSAIVYMSEDMQKSSGVPYTSKGEHSRKSAPAVERPSAIPCFGDMPATEKLRPVGHAKTDLSIRWISKQPDGLYLQSRNGTLRISPIGSAILRISFCKSGQPQSAAPYGIAVSRTEKFWMYKDSGGMVELTTDELIVQADKSTGRLRYMTRDKKPLLAERNKDCRLLENGPGGLLRTWFFLEWAKEERLYGFGPAASGKPVSDKAPAGLEGISLRGSAKYLSDGKRQEPPFLLSDKGYGIVLATEHAAFCCDIPAYGSYLYADYEKQQDFYFIAGKRQDTILNAYEYLCGRR